MSKRTRRAHALPDEVRRLIDELAALRKRAPDGRIPEAWRKAVLAAIANPRGAPLTKTAQHLEIAKRIASHAFMTPQGLSVDWRKALEEHTGDESHLREIWKKQATRAIAERVIESSDVHDAAEWNGQIEYASWG